MAAGSIVVSLLMETASFETDANRAAKAADKRSKEIQASFAKMGAAVGAAAVAAAASFVALTKAGIDSIDALNDVADATGASIENISALDDVARKTGTNLDNVSGILVKFNNVLKEADVGSPLAESLKSIGLNAQELRRLDPAEALRQTAVALSQYADNGDKARLVQELFGKSVKDTAPFLKDLAEQGQLNATVTTEQAEAADKFNKNVFALEKQLSDLGRTIANAVLPGLNEIFVRFNRASQAGQDFATSLARAFGVGGLNNALKNPYENLKRTTDEIQRLQDIINNPGSSRGQVNFASQRLEAAQKDAKELQLVIDEIDKQLAGGGGSPLPSVNVPSGSKTGGKAPKIPVDEFAKVQEEALAAYNKSLEDAGRATNELIVSNFKAAESYRDLLDPTRALNREIQEIQKLVEAGALTPDEGLAAELKKLNDFYDDAKDKTSELDEFTRQAARNIQTSLAEFIFDPFKEGVDGMLEGFLNALRQMAAQAAAAQISKALFGDVGSGGSSSGFLGGALSSIFGGFRATGGPVSGGTSYIVGERGPELFTPSTSGRIIPNDAIGGGNVSVSVNVDASGTSAQGNNQKGAEFGRLLGGEIRRIMLQEKRPGGMLA